MANAPVSSEGASRTSPVAADVTATLAPDTARPCGSRTWPRTVAVAPVCAIASARRRQKHKHYCQDPTSLHHDPSYTWENRRSVWEEPISWQYTKGLVAG
jgi:hypothetical protein